MQERDETQQQLRSTVAQYTTARDNATRLTEAMAAERAQMQALLDTANREKAVTARERDEIRAALESGPDPAVIAQIAQLRHDLEEKTEGYELLRRQVTMLQEVRLAVRSLCKHTITP